MTIKMDNGERFSSLPDDKYGFSNMSPGDSFWIATRIERKRMLNAFRTWQRRFGYRMTAKTRKVGPEDKFGPGYRMTFYGPDPY